MSGTKASPKTVSSVSYRQAGLTLVELLIAMALGLFLSWGAIKAFLTGRQTYITQQGLSRIQENARTVQELIGYDLRDAGNYGCAVGKFVSNFNTANFLSGTTASSGSFNPTAERNFAYAAFATNNVSGAANADTTLLAPLNPAPLAGTDVLFVHTATDEGADVQSVPAPTAVSITVPNRNFAATDILALSDCATNYIFTPAAVATAGSTATITSPVAFPSVPLAGSSVMKLDTAIYYIANNPAGTPALYRRLTGGNSEELLDGVQDLQIEVGIDTNNDGVVDSYVTPNAVTAAQWNAWDDSNADGDVLELSKTTRVEQNVVAIRYSVLLRSDEQILETPQSYTYNGTTTTPTDRRLRQVVTSTVGIRSRLN